MSNEPLKIAGKCACGRYGGWDAELGGWGCYHPEAAIAEVRDPWVDYIIAEGYCPYCGCYLSEDGFAYPMVRADRASKLKAVLVIVHRALELAAADNNMLAEDYMQMAREEGGVSKRLLSQVLNDWADRLQRIDVSKCPDWAELTDLEVENIRRYAKQAADLEAEVQTLRAKPVCPYCNKEMIRCAMADGIDCWWMCGCQEQASEEDGE